MWSLLAGIKLTNLLCVSFKGFTVFLFFWRVQLGKLWEVLEGLWVKLEHSLKERYSEQKILLRWNLLDKQPDTGNLKLSTDTFPRAFQEKSENLCLDERCLSNKQVDWASVSLPSSSSQIEMMWCLQGSFTE